MDKQPDYSPDNVEDPEHQFPCYEPIAALDEINGDANFSKKLKNSELLILSL